MSKACEQHSYLDDIEFVFSEITRIKQLMQSNHEEFRKLPPIDLLSVLRSPSGSGVVIIGSRAAERLQVLSRLAVSRSQHSGYIDSESVCKKIQKIIVKRFIVEKRKLDGKEADRLIASAIRAAAKERTSISHYVPCHLGLGETFDEFSIGQVQFKKSSKILNELKEPIEDYRSSSPGHEDRSASEHRKQSIEEMLIEDATEYYKSFGWVAVLNVPDCDRVTSRYRAKRIVQSTLDCIHVLLSAANSDRIRAGGVRFAIDQRAAFELDAHGKLDVLASKDWCTNALGENWWPDIMTDGAKPLADLMGSAITVGYNVLKPAPLAQRFLDGIAWYGEAVRDEFAASRLVKYITAIERIVITDKCYITATLSDRAAALISQANTRDFSKLKKSFIDVYDLRSALVHGSESPLNLDRMFMLGEAERLSRLVLLHSLYFFERIGLGVKEINNKKLDTMYNRLVKTTKDRIVN